MKHWYRFLGLLLLIVAEMERTDTHTHTHTHTHEPSTVTLAAHVRRGLIIEYIHSSVYVIFIINCGFIQLLHVYIQQFYLYNMYIYLYIIIK